MDHPIPRILVVDDQTNIRRTMTVTIENWGCQAVDAEDGYHAIESVRNDKFDLVFLDIKMPGINGVQTFREIKKLRPDSLVVMMTGCEVPDLIGAAVDEGVMSVVLKPFEPEQIVQILRAVRDSCPERLPSNIGALSGKIQQQIDGTMRDLPLARVTVRIPDNELKALRLLVASGPASESTQPLSSFASLDGVAFYSNEVQVINNCGHHPMICESDTALGVKAALAVPIRSGSDRILGSVAVSFYEANSFGQEVLGKFRELACGIGDLMNSASPDEAKILHGLGRVGIPAA